MSQIKTGTRILTLAGFPVIALLTMGIAMPSCPGQQAIQQQIDALTTRANEGDQKLQGMTTQVGSLSKEMTDAKALLEQLSQTVIAQKDAIATLEASNKELQDKVAGMGKGAAAGAKKKK
jgi:septal ring factor EnvC (AmiA/AmiB activator)